MKTLSLKDRAVFSASIAALTAALLPIGAMAQEAEIEEAETRRLGAIIVTAQKRAESLAAVPVAVTAYSGENLETLGVTDASQLAQFTPGLTANQQNGSNRNFFLRGIGTEDFHLTAAPSVGQYYDDVTLTSGFHARAALFDMERVEVLKGPQNTLFGLNTTGGAINYVSKKPVIGSGRTGEFKLTIGDDSYVGINGAFGADLSDTIAMRAAIQTIDHKGPFVSTFDGTDYGDDGLRAGRLQFLVEPSDKSSWLVNFHASENENNGSPVLAVGTREPGNANGEVCDDFNVFDATGAPTQMVDFERDTDCVGRGGGGLGLTPVDPSSGDWTTVTQNLGYEEVRTRGAYIKYDRDLGFATLTLLGAVDKLELKAAIDGDGGPLPLLNLQQEDDRTTEQFELRLVSDEANDFRWIWGLYYLNDQSDGFTGVTSPGIGAPPSVPGGRVPAVFLDSTKENTGLYGQAEYNITDAITLTAGARWSKEELVGNYRTTRPNATLEQLESELFAADVIALAASDLAGVTRFGDLHDAEGFATNRNITISNPNDEVGYSFKLDWKPADSHMIYASAARGFKGGALDIRATFAEVPAANVQTAAGENSVDPEALDALELGYKGAFDLGFAQVDADVALFTYTYENKQQFATVGGTPIVVNVPESESKGLDGNILVSTDWDLFLNFGFSLLDAKITDEGTSGLFKSGVTLGNSPEQSFTLQAIKDFNIGDNILSVFAGVAHTAESVVPTLLKVEVEQNGVASSVAPVRTNPALNIVNANATYRFGDAQQYSLSVFGNNLTDERYCALTGLNNHNTARQANFQGGLNGNIFCRTSRASTQTIGLSLGVEF